MTFTRAALGGAALWLLTITVLHLVVNHGGTGTGTGLSRFRVGFLPVT